MPSHLSSAQIRGARGMLDWSMLDLARAAEVSISTVKRIEHADAQVVSEETRETVQAAIETAGVRFLEDEGEGPGLRLQR